MYSVVKYAWRAHAVRIVIEFDAAATLETYLKTPTMNKVLFKAQRILPCSFQCLNDSWLLLIPRLDECDEMRTFIQNFNDFSTAFAICLNAFADSFFVKYIFSLVTSHSTTAATWLTKTSRSREVPITKTAGKLFLTVTTRWAFPVQKMRASSVLSNYSCFAEVYRRLLHTVLCVMVNK